MSLIFKIIGFVMGALYYLFGFEILLQVLVGLGWGGHLSLSDIWLVIFLPILAFTWLVGLVIPPLSELSEAYFSESSESSSPAGWRTGSFDRS